MRNGVPLKKLINIGGWIVTLVAGVAVLGAVAFFAVPRLLGWEGVVVLTGSMEPALPTGGLAFVDRKADVTSVGVGDIITFRDERNRQVTHRVADVTRNGGTLFFETKGDANEMVDQALVSQHDVVGRVVMTVPEVGAWSNWLRKRENFYLLIWPPALLIVGMELWNIYSQLRRPKETVSAEESVS